MTLFIHTQKQKQLSMEMTLMIYLLYQTYKNLWENKSLARLFIQS